MSSNATTVPLGGAMVGHGPAAASRPQGRGWEWWVLASLGVVALIALIAGSLGVVVVAADRASFLSPPTHSHYFPSWLAGPLGGAWPQFTDHRSHLKNFFTFSIAGMYVAYLFALVCVPRLHARWTIGAIVIVHVLFFLSPPLSLTDAFNYINYGRMEIVHGLNPYTTIPVVEPHSDPSFYLSNWHHLLSPYGPLFTIFTFALVPLGVAASFWTLKGVLLLFSLGTLVLVWKCARLLGRDPVRAIVFVGLNPVVLVWGLGGDHNDFLMVFFIMLAVYLLLRARAARAGVEARDAGRPPVAPLAPLLGNGRRFLPGLYGGNGNGAAAPAPAPAGAARLLPGMVRRLITPPPATPPAPAPAPALGAPATAAARTAAGTSVTAPETHAAPRNGSTAELAKIAEAAKTTEVAPDAESAESAEPPAGETRPARAWSWAREHLLTIETGAGAALVTAVTIKASAGVLLPVLLLASRRRLAMLTGMVAALLVLGGASLIAFGAHIPDLATQGRMVTALSLPNLLGLALGQGGETSSMKTILGLVLIASALAGAAYAWRKRDPIAPAGWVTLALLLTLSWVLPWYVLWLLPLAALARSGVLRGAALVLGVYLILAWVPLMPDMIHSIGFKPSTTELGQAHQRAAKELLR